MPPQKYKRRVLWNEFGHSHFLTFSCFHRKPYLLDDRVCELLAESINKAAKRHNFGVLAYVFMPDHVHLLIHPLGETYNMSLILKAIKQGPAQRAKSKGWIQTNLWERGGGYDSNIVGYDSRLDVTRYIHENPVRKEMVNESSHYYWSSANWYFTGEQASVICHIFDTLGED